jgi:hypothetical protein
MAGKDLSREIASMDYARVAEQREEHYEALRFAGAALEELLRYPRGGLVDMLEVRRSIAKTVGIEDPELAGEFYPEIEDGLTTARDTVTELAESEARMMKDSSGMSARIASGELRVQD